MSGKAAGAGIAIVNSVGAIGAFAGPALMGWLRDLTHSYSAGLWTIALCMALAALVYGVRAILFRAHLAQLEECDAN